MTDHYDVNFTDLSDMAGKLRTINSEAAQVMRSVDVTSFGPGMAGSWSESAARSFSDTWTRLVEGTASHMDSHPATLSAVAQAYQNYEEDAHTAIRGFFTGRVR